MINFITNKVIASSALSMFSSAFLALAFVNNSSIFIELNYYFLAVLFSIIPDSAIVIRLERVFSRGKAFVNGLYTSLLGLYSIISAVVFVASILEYVFFGTLYLVIVFSRHLLNLFRLTHPYINGLVRVPVFSNLLVVLKNLLIIVVLMLYPHIETPIVIIGFLSLGEIFVIALYSLSNFKGGKLKFSFSFSFSGYFKKYILHKAFLVNISQLASITVDRLALIYFYPASAQEVFFKYKILQQHIDGAYGIFGYKVHIEILSNKLLQVAKDLLGVAFVLHVIGAVTVWYFFTLEYILSYVIFEVLILMLIFKRIVDGVVSPILIKLGTYREVVYKNFMEVAVIGFYIVASFEYFHDDIGMLFLGLVSLGFLSTLLFAIYLQYKYEISKFFSQ